MKTTLKIAVSILFLSFLFYGCSSVQTDENVLFVGKIDRTQYPDDMVGINNVSIENDILKLEANYSGGCREHNFKLVFESLTDGKPAQANAFLSHNANGDNCKMLVDEELSFDLSGLKRVYVEKYHSETGEILIKFINNNKNISYKF